MGPYGIRNAAKLLEDYTGGDPNVARGTVLAGWGEILRGRY